MLGTNVAFDKYGKAQVIESWTGRAILKRLSKEVADKLTPGDVKDNYFALKYHTEGPEKALDAVSGFHFYNLKEV